MFHFFTKKKAACTPGIVLATQDGEVLPLSEMPDPVFADGTLGDGVCVLPFDGKVRAPVDGKVAAVTETGHAFGMVTEDGAEFLIHIGVDTVEMKGRGFKPCVKAGQSVKAGDLLCEADLDLIRESGFQSHTAILITNCDDFIVEETCSGTVQASKDQLYRFRRK